jgi:hypothetical protein
MKLSELKIGDIVCHYCCGNWVIGEVVETDGRSVKTSHRPVNWGRDEYTETWIHPSSPLQAKYHHPTTPKAMYQDKLITV